MALKKLIHRPEAVVEERAEGLAAAHVGLRRLPGHTVLVWADRPAAWSPSPTPSGLAIDPAPKRRAEPQRRGHHLLATAYHPALDFRGLSPPPRADGSTPAPTPMGARGATLRSALSHFKGPTNHAPTPENGTARRR